MNKILTLLLIFFTSGLIWLGIRIAKEADWDFEGLDDISDLYQAPLSPDGDVPLVDAYDDPNSNEQKKQTSTGPVENISLSVTERAKSVSQLPPIMTDDNEKGIRVEPSLRSIGEDWQNDPTARTNFTMPLPDGSEVEIEVEGFNPVGASGGEFYGKVIGFPDSRVQLSYRRNSEAGWIHLPSENRLIKILPGLDGAFYFHEVPAAEFAAPNTPPSFIPQPPDFNE